MERESTGMKFMAANCEGSQSPPRAVELRKKKNFRPGRELKKKHVVLNTELVSVAVILQTYIRKKATLYRSRCSGYSEVCKIFLSLSI
jgi:hypothetical protein